MRETAVDGGIVTEREGERESVRLWNRHQKLERERERREGAFVCGTDTKDWSLRQQSMRAQTPEIVLGDGTENKNVKNCRDSS